MKQEVDVKPTSEFRTKLNENKQPWEQKPSEMNDLGKLDPDVGSDWVEFESEILRAADNPRMDRFVCVARVGQWPPPDLLKLEGVKWVPMVLVLGMIYMRAPNDEAAERIARNLVAIPVDDNIPVLLVHTPPYLDNGFIIALKTFAPADVAYSQFGFQSRGGQA